MIQGFRDGTLLRIYLDENDRSRLEPRYTAIAEYLRRTVRGATVFRGIEGFGGHDRIHAASVFAWQPNLPIRIEVVDERHVLEALLPELERLVGEGLMTLEDTQFWIASEAAR